MPDGLPMEDPRLQSVLIPAAAIEARVAELASQISRDFRQGETLHLVAVLKGAWVFLADLGRAIRRAGGPPVHYHFLQASTYADGTKGAADHHRHVCIQGVPESVRGRDVVLVEDILDQGFTLAGVREALLSQYAVRSVRVCVLLQKALAAPTPEVARLRREVVPDYVGFEVPDRWVVGYGLDVSEDFRDLPYVAVVDERRCRSQAETGP